MTTFEVDAVIVVEAEDDEAAVDIVTETLTELKSIKQVEVAYIADTSSSSWPSASVDGTRGS